MAKRKRLTDKEFALVCRWTEKTHVDEILDIHTGRLGNDYFMDYENNKKLSLEKGFKEIAEAVAYPFSHEGFNEEESKILLSLLEEFGVNENTLNYIKNLKE